MPARKGRSAFALSEIEPSSPVKVLDGINIKFSIEQRKGLCVFQQAPRPRIAMQSKQRIEDSAGEISRNSFPPGIGRGNDIPAAFCKFTQMPGSDGRLVARKNDSAGRHGMVS